MDINKIIDIVRSLKEDASTCGCAPTNNVGDGKIAGTKEAGDDPPVFRKKKKYIYGGTGSRKMWMTKNV